MHSERAERAEHGALDEALESMGQAVSSLAQLTRGSGPGEEPRARDPRAFFEPEPAYVPAPAPAFSPALTMALISKS